MIGQGSTKYPQEDYLVNFLNRNNGKKEISATDTVLKIITQVSSEKLSELADIIAWAISSPIFKKEKIESEIKAIDDDYQAKKQSINIDSLLSVLASIALEGELADFSIFSGNKETLSRPDIDQKLRDFHSMHFTADRMKLVICSNKPWEDLYEISRIFNVLSSKKTKNLSLVNIPIEAKFQQQFSGSIVKYNFNTSSVYLDVNIVFPYDKLQEKSLAMEYIAISYYALFPEVCKSKFLKRCIYSYIYNARLSLLILTMELMPLEQKDIDEILCTLKNFLKKQLKPRFKIESEIKNCLVSNGLLQNLDDLKTAEFLSNPKFFENYKFDFVYDENFTRAMLEKAGDEKNWLVLLSTPDKDLTNTEKYYSIKYSDPVPLNLKEIP